MALSKKKQAIPFHSLEVQQTLNVHLRQLEGPGLGKTVIESAHRDDYYILLFQQEGVSRLMVDFREVILTGPCIYYILPGQVHHYKSIQEVSGWLLGTDPLSIDPAYRQVFEEALSEPQPAMPSLQIQQQLHHCFKAMRHLLQHPATIFNDTVLSHLISVCAGIFAGIFLAAKERLQISKDRPAIVTHQFRHLVSSNYGQEKSPAAYATLLNLSLPYLNECVKGTTGKPVSYWIRQAVMLEAKRLLAYSTFSIKEIAYKLGYDDHTYFSRLFIKEMNITPARFRKSYHG
ncbi:AraC-like DNA-binding protein [Chitinophaga polysaccharea]|uniref:AraC-like DNA-binding protein n=1 Tax=Chitinophaga polysaccharea TaxID=1293035 RepID=A0A561PXW8_9BACT|nr:AraC family transcriptional regulator [Chitinophaga polysaccharea]TWF42945.1 AraC-like DNA-binding protein [Chitinophaga polysaccharea]